jgi:hypothetical protein
MHFQCELERRGNGVMEAGGMGGEKWVGWVSGACAVHCLAHPVMVLVLPAAALGERLEGAVLLGLLGVSAALLLSGIRRHGRYVPALPVVAATMLWVVALAGLVPEPAKAMLIAAGGLLSFWGLTWSRRLEHACPCGECVPGEAQQRSAF